MIINTSRFGDIEVEQDKIITMIRAFPGFPDSNRFIIRPHSRESALLWLQSLDDPALAFVVIPAVALRPDYRPTIPESTLRDLELGDNAPELLLILTIPHGEPKKMTANLLGPVVINPHKRLACQVVLDPTIYELAWPVFRPS